MQASSWTLCSILALPAIATMYWLQPRARVRRIAGLFLWRNAAQAQVVPGSQKRGRLLAVLDLAAAALLVALACGLITWNSEPDPTHETWLIAGMRSLLCFAMTALLITGWRFAASKKVIQ